MSRRCSWFDVEVQAAPKMQISQKKFQLVTGKKKTLKIKNKKGKITWKSSRKTVATVSAKGVVKARKAGKATITAVVKTKKKKKKKFYCKVTVKNKTKQTDTHPEQVQMQDNSAPGNVAPGTVTAGTPQSLQTQSPQGPSNENPEENSSFVLTGITFEDETLTYMMGTDGILVDTETLKTAVPDVEKCTFDAYYNNISYTGLKACQVVWHDEPYFSDVQDSGYYEFMICLTEKDGTQHYIPQVMLEYIHDVYCDNRGLCLTSLEYDGVEIPLSRGAEYTREYLMELNENETVKDRIPDMKKAVIYAFWADRKLEITSITDLYWNEYNECYQFQLMGKNGAQRLKTTISIYGESPSFDLEEIKSNDSTLYMQKMASPKQKYAASFECIVPNGGYLKDYISDLEKELSFVCSCKGERREDAVIRNVVWHNKGYYTFELSLSYGSSTIMERFYSTKDNGKRHFERKCIK